ncbi:MAG: putative endonuclease [Neolewinella sp.]|jgi:putative endonuclease
MTDRQKTGEIGESLARRWLETSGYEVLEQGYRYKRVELDLVVKTENDCLVFVEVKTRRGLKWGHPSGAVSVSKERNMAKAARAYMRQIDHSWEVRFDIIAILLYKDGSHSLEHIEDAFFPGVW